MNVLGIAGSLRKASYNRMLLACAVSALEEMGKGVTVLVLDDVPLYNQDVEDAGFPTPVMEVREKVLWADVVVIATPEYNHSVSGVLKNTVDWVSRPPNAWGGKVIAMMGASAGACGTAVAQSHLRAILSVLGCRIVGAPTVYVRNAQEAFNPDGTLANASAQRNMVELLRRTVEFAEALKG